VVQVVDDFDLAARAPDASTPEFDLRRGDGARGAARCPMTWLQRDPGGEQWQAIPRARRDSRLARGLPSAAAGGARAASASSSASMRRSTRSSAFRATRKSRALPLTERAAALREPARQARILVARRSGAARRRRHAPCRRSSTCCSRASS
jgi:hypothetical protein